MAYFTPIDLDALATTLSGIRRQNVRRNARWVAIELLRRCRRCFDDSGHPLQRGECWFGQDELAEQCDLSRKEMRSVLEALRKVNYTAIKTASNGSTASIINFDSYIIDQIEKGQQKGQERASKGPAKGHNLNENENGLVPQEEKRAPAVERHIDRQSPLALSNVELLAPDSTFDEEAIFSAWLEAKRAAKWQTRFTDAEARRTIYVLHCDPDASPRLSGADVQHIMERWAAQRWPLKPAHLWHLNEKTGLPNYELHLHFSQNATNHQPKADTYARSIYQTPAERRAAERKAEFDAALAAID